jgi:hypothetical protein
MGIHAIPDDEDLVSFVEALRAPTGSWISGVGTLTDVVLSVPGDGAEVSREFPGVHALVGLSGPVTGPLMATLATPGALVGGRVLRGRATGVTVFVQDAVPVAASKVPTGRGTPLRSGAAALGDDEAEEAPKFGDRVDHFVFGLCDVMVVREERMKIRDVGGGRLREIHLGAVKVLPPVEEDGRRVFKLVRRGN